MVYRDENPMLGNYQTNDIKTIADAIRFKMYGKDTREAMAQSLEKMGQLAMQSAVDPNSVAKQAYDTAVGSIDNAYEALKKATEVSNRLNQLTTAQNISEATEIIDARIGNGGIEYGNLSESIRGQVKSLMNSIKGMNAISFVAQSGIEIDFKSAIQIYLFKGQKLKIKLQTEKNDDISGWQLWINGKFKKGYTSDIYNEKEYILDEDTYTVGFYVDGSRVRNDFKGSVIISSTSSYQNSSKLNKLEAKLGKFTINYFGNINSDSEDKNAVTDIFLEKGTKIMVKLDVTKPDAVVPWQLWANGKFLRGFDSKSKVGTWNAITLQEDVVSFGFYTNATEEDVTGTITIATNTYYELLSTITNNYIGKFDGIDSYAQVIDISNEKDTTGSLNNINLPAGTRIKVKLEVDDSDVDKFSSWQLWMNGKFLHSFSNELKTNVWQDFVLEEDSYSFGYAFYSDYVNKNFKAKLRILARDSADFVDIKNKVAELSGMFDSKIQDYLYLKEKEIRELTSKVENGLAFIFITDLHFADNCLMSKKMIKHILDNTSISFALCGGDFPKAYGTKNDLLKARDTFLDYQNYIGKGRFFAVQGNHDFTIKLSPNTEQGFTASNSLIYDTLIRPNEVSLNSTQAGKEYYYIDIPSQKTRIFMLNSMDGNVKDDLTKPWGTIFSISQMQVDWLVEKIKEKNDWNYIFVEHVPCDINLNSYHPTQKIFHAIAESVNNKTTFNYDENSVIKKADFSNIRGKVVAIFAGHSHVDQSSTVNGVLSITTTSDAYYSDGGWIRNKIDETAQAFDVVIIDYDQGGRIITKRIGAGKDRNFSIL